LGKFCLFFIKLIVLVVLIKQFVKLEFVLFTLILVQ
jgi:hypothetical protein